MRFPTPLTMKLGYGKQLVQSRLKCLRCKILTLNINMTDKFALTWEDFQKVLDNPEHNILWPEYNQYRARCNDVRSTKGRERTVPMSFDDWWRAMAYNAKDRAKYE